MGGSEGRNQPSAADVIRLPQAAAGEQAEQLLEKDSRTNDDIASTTPIEFRPRPTNFDSLFPAVESPIHSR